MIRLIGGEMAAWTEDRPPAGGALHAHVLDQLPEGATVLVAGPHDNALIDALARRTTVTCLVRTQLAAAELAARGVRVLCGTLAKLRDADRYDVVVALDGLDRLCSVEGPQLDWAESLQALKRALRASGTLLLAVENELGVHRLVDPVTATGSADPGAWRVLGEFDPSKPGCPARLTDRLAAEGLTVAWLGACWPTPGSPTLLATPEALTRGPADALAAVAARAAGLAYAGRSALSDPRRLSAAAVRSGAGPEFAASWLVVAHLAAAPATAVPLPPVLIGDGPVAELTEGDDRNAPDGWLRRVVRAEPGRDGAALDGPLPIGRLLEELLVGACLRRDLPALRRLLTGWAAALPRTAADNVVVDSDRFAALDPSVPDRPDVLELFASTLVIGGYPHPWPTVTDVKSLSAILAAAAGRPGELPDAVAADPAVDSRREHEEQMRALHRQLADAVARNEWYERELGHKESELRKARVQIATFSGSLGFRVAKLGYGIARKARNHLRKGT